MNNQIDSYIDSHPRECLYILAVTTFFIWQSVPAFIGLVMFICVKRYNQIPLWSVLATGVLLMSSALYFQDQSLPSFFINGFKSNFSLWSKLLNGAYGDAISTYYLQSWNYVVGFPFFMAAILGLIDLIQKNSHQQTLQALQRGVEAKERLELDEKTIEKKINKIVDENFDGTALGVSKYTGKPVIVPDRNINQIMMVLGTTGSGKTITLRRFYKRAIMKGYPLIIVDGKPDEANIDSLIKLCEKYGREFIGFNCGNFQSYDPLAEGGFTELKEKVISLKHEWSSDYYRSIAEDYLQTAFEVLLKSKKKFDLRDVVEYLNFDDLHMLASETKNDELIKRVNGLENYAREDITGLQAHLNILINSELGQFFQKNETTFNLTESIQQNAIVYFALPALRFPIFSKVLGKLVINDIKAVIDRNVDSKQKIFTVFDEFSVFAGEQVLNLVNMGRGKGVHAIFGTQGLADLDKVDATFKNQVLNCVNTLVCHRLNDKDSAETVANWAGTKNAYTVTAQINLQQSDSGMGSVRVNKEFIIHPDEIKQGLQIGEAFYVTKVDGFMQDKIKVKFL